MSQTIRAVYENGVLRPLGKVPFREHEKLELKIERKKDVVEETRGIIKVRDKKFAKKVALSDEFSILES